MKLISHEEFLEKLNNVHPSIEPLEQYNGYDTEIKFKCKDCGTEWVKKPYLVIQAKYPCQVCGNVNGTNPNRGSIIIRKIEQKHPNIEVIGNYVNAHTKIAFKCLECGKIDEKTPDNLLRRDNVCTFCSRYYQSSFPEQALYFYVKKFFPDAISCFKEGFGKMELDIYIPSKKLGIEYDGRWHNGEKSRQKEERKYNICRAKGITLIRIKEMNKTTDKPRNCDRFYTLKMDPNTKELENAILTVFKEEFGLTFDCRIEDNRVAILEQYHKAVLKKSLLAVNPALASEWHPTANGSLKPENFAANSGDAVYWRCSKGHKWLATIASRNSGCGCPKCAHSNAGLKQRLTNEEFLEKVSKKNLNIEILEPYVNSKTKILVKCKKCKRTWKVFPYSLTSQGSQCEECYGHAKKTTEKFAKELHSKHPNLEVLEEYKNCETPIKVKCNKCGTQWSSSPVNLLKGKGCKECRRKSEIEGYRNTVESWRRNNPSGSKAKCHRDTKLALSTISKFWTNRTE